MSNFLGTQLLASLFLAYVLPWYFFGLLTMQVYLYSIAPLKDRFATKVAVYGIYFLQLSQILLFANELYGSFKVFDTFSNILDAGTSWLSVVVIDGTVASIVQLFYAWRIYIIGRGKLAPMVLSMTSMVSLAFYITTAVKYKAGSSSLALFEPDVLVCARVALACSAACDIIISCLMVYYLKYKHEVYFRKTLNIVNRILQLYIETGVLTASTALLAFVIICLPSHPPFFIVVASAISGIYSNSCMTVINSRIKLKTYQSNGQYAWEEQTLRGGQIENGSRNNGGSTNGEFAFIVPTSYITTIGQE